MCMGVGEVAGGACCMGCPGRAGQGRPVPSRPVCLPARSLAQKRAGALLRVVFEMQWSVRKDSRWPPFWFLDIQARLDSTRLDSASSRLVSC